MTIKESLIQQYPLLTFPEAMRRDLFFGVFLVIFLLVFTPFGLDVFAYSRTHIIVGYGMVTFGAIVINDIIAYRIFPGVFSEKNWKVYHQVLWSIWHLLCMGVANLSFGVAVGAFPLTLESFFKLELYILLCAIIPIMGIVLVRQNYLLRRNTQVAEGLNKDINYSHSLPSEPEKDSILTFMAENNRDFLKVSTASVLYISAQDNYAEFVLWKDGKISKQLIRSSLSRIEESLQGRPEFFRCHRAFIVHTGRIRSMEGNSQGCRLHIEGTDEMIPVSRAKIRALRELFGHQGHDNL